LFGISKLLLNLQDRNLELVIGLFVLALLLAVVTYRRTFPPLRKRKKALLLGLRVLALLCLFLVLSEPILTIAKKQVKRPVVALLLDASQSMNLKGTEVRRVDELRQLLTRQAFRDIAAQAELKTYGFADSIFSINFEEGLPDSLGSATAMGEAVRSTERELKEENLAAMVILSDGASNLGEDPALVARSSGVRIYTCGTSDYQPVRDLSINRIVYNEIGYVGDQIPIQVDISQIGFDDSRIQISLKENNTTLTQQNSKLGKSGATQTVELNVTPEKAGLRSFTVALPVLDGESVSENNRRSFSIKVLKSKIKVLLISGSLNWEYTFLKRVLDKDKNVELETLVYGKNRQPIAGRFPQGVDQLNSFDILILVDPPRFIFSRHKDEIEDYVMNQGGSALLLLGREFTDTHGFTEASSLLPFVLAGSRISYSPAYLTLRLTEEGKLHPVTRLADDPEENERLWSDLPPFQGVAILGPAAKDATNLAAFRDPRIPGSLSPGIAVRNFGKGKVMAITVTPFWRWDFLLWGVGKDNQAYQTFWNNSIRWMVVREDMDLVNFSTDKKIYMGGERITLKAKIFDQNYQKIQDASVMAIVRGEASPDSEVVNLGLDDLGNYNAVLRALPPGKYSFEGKVFRDSKEIGSKAGEFLVEEFSMEDSDLKTNFDLLKRIADLSGGRYYEKGEIENLANDLDLAEKEEQKTREIQLWNHPLLLAVFVLCLSIEWAIRKRSQLQ